VEDLVREEERRDVGLVFWDVFLVFWDGDDASAKTRLLVLVRLERLNAGMVLWCAVWAGSNCDKMPASNSAEITPLTPCSDRNDLNKQSCN
jgi:hypothetical protein